MTGGLLRHRTIPPALRATSPYTGEALVTDSHASDIGHWLGMTGFRVRKRGTSYLTAHKINPYTALAAVPNTITGPAIRNILAAMPVTKPSGCVKIDIQFFRNFFSCLQSGGRLLF